MTGALGDPASWSPTAVAVTVFSLALAVLLVDAVRSWYRLSHVPGPFWAAFSKYWMVKHSLKSQQPYAIQQANEQYGPLVRIGLNELATDDPELLRRIMAVRSRYTRGPWYNALRFQAGQDHLFSQRDDAEHMRIRNKMAAGYSGKENESMEHTVDEHIARLVRLLEDNYVSTSRQYRPVDFARKVQYFTLDVISDLAFGHPFGFMEQDADVYDFIKTTRDFFPVAVLTGNIPSLVSLLHSPLFRGLLPKASDKLGFGAFIGPAVLHRMHNKDAVSQPDMLGSFIHHGLNQDEASRESLLNVVAGSDTTATTIRLMMLNILSNSTAYRKLQEEIDNGIKAGTISSPITDAEARNLPYLQAAIKEGLRIKAPAAGPLFKQVPPEGDMIDGKFIPGGTQIGTSPFAIYHSKRIFGDDAEMFLPERWLDADPDRFAAMAGVVDLVFSSGKWGCLGKSVAFMELNKVFVELMRRFDFAGTRPERPVLSRMLESGLLRTFL